MRNYKFVYPLYILPSWTKNLKFKQLRTIKIWIYVLLPWLWEQLFIKFLNKQTKNSTQKITDKSENKSKAYWSDNKSQLEV